MSETDQTEERLPRPSSPFLDKLLGTRNPVLDHGHVRVIDYMGDEAAIVQAARISYGLGTDLPEKDRALIRYLLRHWHTTPFEMCEIKLHVKLPIFVARQWIRHRTANVNEISGRYTALPEEFYLPLPENLARQSTDNKQGRSEVLNAREAEDVRIVMDQAARAGFGVYETFISVFDLAKELARINLPLSTYTEFYWKIDLHNLLHFLRLRMDPHAQYEIRVYADTIWALVQGWMPNVAEAFDDYRLRSHTFSKSEMAVVRKLVEAASPFSVRQTLDLLKPNTSKREYEAFAKAIGWRGTE